MPSFLIQFNSFLVAEAHREFDSGAVELPLRWAKENQVTGTVKKPGGGTHNCELLLNEDRTILLGIYCSCNSVANLFRMPSVNPCKHVIAIIVAYEQNPNGVSTTNSPSPSAIPKAVHRSQKFFPVTKKVNKPLIRDNTKLQLDAKTKGELESVARAFEENRALEDSNNVPDLAYVVCDTEPGKLPELKVFNIHEQKKSNRDMLVQPKSPLWAKASIQQKYINAVRKMVIDAADRKLDFIDRWIYSSLWMFLLKTCLSTGKCHFGSLDTAPLNYGPQASHVMFVLRRRKESNQINPYLITDRGAPLCTWSFPYYIDRKANCAGEIYPNHWMKWFPAFWIKAAAPASEWTKLSQLITGRVDLKSLEQYFPELYECWMDGEKHWSKPGIADLKFSLSASANQEIPELKAWKKQANEDGSSNYVPIDWDIVRVDGSALQQFIAASYEKFLRHTTAKEIAETAVCHDLWLEFIQFIVNSKQCYWEDPNKSLLLTMGPPIKGLKVWVKHQNGYNLILCAGQVQNDKALAVLSWFIPMYVNPQTNQIGLVLGFPVGPRLKALRNLGTIPLEMATAACNFVRAHKLENFVGLLNSQQIWHDIKPDTTLSIEEEAQARTLFLQFDGVKETCYEKEGTTHIKTMDRTWVSDCLENMKALGFDPVKNKEDPLRYMLLPKMDSCWRQLLDEIRQLRKKDFVISKTTEQQLRPLEIVENNFSFKASDSTGAGWFSMSLAVKVGNQEVNLLPILISVIHGLPEISEDAIDCLNDDGKYVAVLSSGRLVSIPFDRMKFILMSLRELLPKNASTDANEIGLPTAHAISILSNEIFANSEKRICESLTSIMEQSARLTSKCQLEPASNFRASLRDYQKVGLYWLDQISKMKAGGILADEMGLGKTVQVIAKLALDKANSSEVRPVLIVCPASLIGNWTIELKRFSPELQVMQYVGAGRSKLKAYFKHSDVILTTYQLLLRDQSILTDMWWHGVFLDEAHTIKNSNAAITAAAKELVADYRICLTGTPIENHLGELWSLFDFLMPGLLGSKARFTKFVRKPSEEGDVAAPAMLRKVISPFILRRLKEDVLKDLPEKNESIIRVELTEKQLDLYETARLLSNEELRKEIANKNFSPRNPKTVEILTRMRQVCLHPRLCKLEVAKDVKESAKFKTLFERMDELLIRGRKLLIFSQFVEMLDLISDELTHRSTPFLKLVGDVQIDDRTRMVREFQESNVQVFLISLHAGGYGLNLTEADTVIIYDPWWNPAKEMQAIDRAHRIGQSKPVFVFRMIAANTIEERMLELKAKKQAISNLIYETDDALLNELTEDDIYALLAPVSDPVIV
ncbi:MAG: DEAD/DEAH box helicase [Candidatus Obscuribacterales bacterium]|nr:DEAD/DEAH box helicase [Candidatus Obscuribacterales bacterium]